jgi:uncharacterized membrane protein YphA (DoxX/SURF4 family)
MPSFGKETALVTPTCAATASRAPWGQNKVAGIRPVTGSRKSTNNGHRTHKPEEVTAMRDNPIHTFIQVLTGNLPDQLSSGEFRWFMVALYWVLLIGSLATAYTNWRMDAAQRTGTHVSIYAMRLVSAGMWYLGSLWKLPVSDGFKFWLDNTVKYSSFDAHAAIMQVFLDHIALVQPLVFLLETALAVSLMLGFMVRLAGVVGVLFILNLLIGLYNDPTEWPWTYVGIICTHGMFAVAQAGRSFGIDNLLAKRLIPGLSYDGPVARAIALAS